MQNALVTVTRDAIRFWQGFPYPTNVSACQSCQNQFNWPRVGIYAGSVLCRCPTCNFLNGRDRAPATIEFQVMHNNWVQTRSRQLNEEALRERVRLEEEISRGAAERERIARRRDEMIAAGDLRLCSACAREIRWATPATTALCAATCPYCLRQIFFADCRQVVPMPMPDPELLDRLRAQMFRQDTTPPRFENLRRVPVTWVPELVPVPEPPPEPKEEPKTDLEKIDELLVKINSEGGFSVKPRPKPRAEKKASQFRRGRHQAKMRADQQREREWRARWKQEEDELRRQQLSGARWERPWPKLEFEFDPEFFQFMTHEEYFERERGSICAAKAKLTAKKPKA